MTLRVAIMSDETGWHTRQLQAALRARGALGRCVDLAACQIDTTAAWHGLVLPGYGRELPDAVLVRGIAGGSFEQVTKRLGVLHALRELGVPVYNDARAIERSVDKSMTSLLLHAARIPAPATWATESAAQARRIAMRETAAGHALVLKPLFGSQGKDLQLVGEVDGVHHPMPDIDTRYAGLAYLQRFVPPVAAPGFDWRVLVVGGRALTAMRRVSAHWVHNVAQGARCEPAELEHPLAQLAERAALALDMDYAGVDLIAAASGPRIQVLEVNGVAAWQGLQRVTRFNIAGAIVDDLLDRKMAQARRRQQEGMPPERRA
ncbi:RimK family alpha-L-glutamate ligase [Variovorax sp. WS11]|uniref:ATP-grasp domain-containing protein n=1 Tax=Variovorax sp. WS11 TaxID=1105204 RepID=UPI000D0CF8AD|nr:RimK family alpha-L-glutamate ligase [Variovorax sp. WS11]NDZ11606.1 RimK family alpha-L-glutamate ligase [Variovorax sp. WS11]PSL86554.1 RimK family alpha-L-glutamate ligase [Variovorax sp. WS11]